MVPASLLYLPVLEHTKELYDEGYDDAEVDAEATIQTFLSFNKTNTKQRLR